MGIRIRNLEMERKFFFWLILSNLLLIAVSIFQWNSNSEVTKLWFLYIFPLLTACFYIIITFHFHIINRGFFLSIPIIIVSYFLSVTFVFNLLSSMSPEYQTSINDYFYTAGYLLPLYMIGFMVGGILGYLIALPITNPRLPSKGVIEKNSITFQLSFKTKDENIALMRLFGRTIKKNLNYYRFKELKKNVVVYKYNLAFLLKHIFMVIEDDKISFFPYIKDGFGYYINKDLLPYIKTVGQNMMNLNTCKTTSLIASEFEEYTEPHKLIGYIKSIRNIRLSRNDMYCLLGLLIFFIVLLIIFVIPNVNIGMAISLDILTIILGIVGIPATLISIAITLKLLKLKEKKR